MSAADDIFIKNMNDILNNGTWDTDYPVRPHWADGTPAHTVKKFCIVNRYDLSKELPILTIRRTYFKSCLDELLWIWQKKSNNIHDLHSHVWDSWADETGSIGKAYGYQLAKKAIYPEGEFDQVDRVLYDLKHNPHSRRIMTNLYNFEDLHEMHLYPCAYSMTFNVTGDTPVSATIRPVGLATANAHRNRQVRVIWNFICCNSRSLFSLSVASSPAKRALRTPGSPPSAFTSSPLSSARQNSFKCFA